MDVFDLDRCLVEDYERFARSFTQIRASDIETQVKAIYSTRRFWPEPLISLNPHFERDAGIDALVTEGSLHRNTGIVFRVVGQPITLYRHQAQSIAKAAARQSFVVTTGTGSGKSLCFFISIIDAAISARVAGEVPRTRAIVIYPMNALANSQLEELRKFVGQSGLPEKLRPTFERYTGQEDDDERTRIRELRPDILLTNFMMLELLMTRQNSLDQAVISKPRISTSSSSMSFTLIAGVREPTLRCSFDDFGIVCAEIALPYASGHRPRWQAMMRAPTRRRLLRSWPRACSEHKSPAMP